MRPLDNDPSSVQPGLDDQPKDILRDLMDGDEQPDFEVIHVEGCLSSTSGYY